MIKIAAVKRWVASPLRAGLAGLLLLGLLYTFIPYGRLVLPSDGHWQLDLVEFEDRSRTRTWEEAIAQERDPFLTELFGDRKEKADNLGYLYSYTDLVPYIFYKVFGLRGAALMVAHKVFVSFLGIASVLAVFLLVHTLMGPRTAFLAGCLFLFSPHVWLTYNFDGGVMRAYNLTLSLFAALFYLLAFQTKRTRFTGLASGAMALNFLYFHIGSFTLPLILLTFACHRWAVKDEGPGALRLFFKVLGLALLGALFINIVHCLYFRLPLLATVVQWFKGYFAKGEVASHSVSGIVLFHAGRIAQNTKEAFNGLFWSGRTSDWHTTIAPPGVPYLYTRFFLFFFIPGAVRLCRERRERSALFLWWALFFVAVYSFLIVYRQKNLVWILPALAAITAMGIEAVARVLRWWSWEEFPMKKAVALLSVFLVAASALAGGRLIFHKLPHDNFYDGGAYMGHLELSRKIRRAGADKKSLVLFTLPQMQVGARMTRFLLEGRAPVAFLSQFDVNFPPRIDEWRAFEEGQRRKGRSLYYCFFKFDNRNGYVYGTDETFRELFVKMHPDIQPEIVRGTDTEPLWHLYVVRPQTVQTEREEVPREGEEDASMTDLLVAKTFKLLARGFLLITDFEALKTKGIKKINKMSEEKWQKRSRKVKEILKDLPADVRQTYGFRQDMSRQEVIRSIKGFDKKMAQALIDAVPDALIAKRFREYRSRSSRELSGTGQLEQVKNLWQRALAKWSQEK